MSAPTEDPPPPACHTFGEKQRVPNPKYSHFLNCTISSWYREFRSLTIPTRILDIPDDFLEYLRADGIVLPDDDDGNENEQEKESSTENEAPKFTEFQTKVVRCIADLGGAVFPKLNWSSPRDASWIATNNSLKCTTFSEVCLLLKSSDFVAHDLTDPFAGCDMAEKDDGVPSVQYQLALRKWQEILPGMEFRVFVRDCEVVGISQRYTSNYYPQVATHKEELCSEIVDFHEKKIKRKFPDRNYVFDIYRESKDRTLLLDFAAYGQATDPLLYDWEELLAPPLLQSPPELESQQIQGITQHKLLRYVNSHFGMQPNPYLAYRVPSDLIDLTAGTDSNKLVDFLKMETQNQDDATSSDEN